MNKKKNNALISAVVIAALYIIGMILVASIYFFAPDMPNAMRLIMTAFYLVFAFAMIPVLKERIKEIKGGENDDLDNY